MCNHWRAISANQSPRVPRPESLLFPFDVQSMYAVCVGQLWERRKFGILSRVSNFKGRWMKTTHLCVNCEFLFICVVNVETKFKHCLVWGPSRGHILRKHFGLHLVSTVRLYDSQFCIFTDTADLDQKHPRPHPAIEKYKLINNTIRLPQQTSPNMPLTLYFWLNKTVYSYHQLLLRELLSSCSSDILASLEVTNKDDTFFQEPTVVPRLLLLIEGQASFQSVTLLYSFGPKLWTVTRTSI